MFSGSAAAATPAFKQPLRYPRRSGLDGRDICRFHNYDPVGGCKHFKDGRCTDRDHTTCHFCLEKGHPAHACAQLRALQ